MRFNGNNAGYDEVCFVLCDWSDGLRGVAAMVEETKLVRTMTYKVCYQLTDDPNSTMRRDKVSGPFESREMAEHFLVNLAVNPEFIYGIVEEGDV